MITFRPLTAPGEAGWQQAAELYRSSFPPQELRADADHLRALTDPAFCACGIWAEDRFAGILYYWQLAEDDWVYVEHFAILPELRGQQIGSEALATFLMGRRVVLEIDPPVEPIAIRRLHFYERLGFAENPQEYIHPAYTAHFVPYRLVLMSYPARLTNNEARTLADFVRERVMRYSEHRQTPTTPVLP